MSEEEKRAAGPATGREALDKAFEALPGYGWGQDPAALKPIDDALRASYGDATGRRDLEARLGAVLKTDAPRAAKDFACRCLRRIGSAAAVPALAALLLEESLAHMARFALEPLPCPEAGEALREALSIVKGKVKVGVIHSLGARGDRESVWRLADLLSDRDLTVAAAAAAALGQIGTSEAARALKEKAPETVRRAASDARLDCAERLLAAGKKAEAAAIYEALRSAQEPEQVRLAATLGLSAVASTR